MAPAARSRRAWTDDPAVAHLGRKPGVLADNTEVTAPPLSRDAAIVVGLAGTALAFASSKDDEVERWLRPLRLYGDAATALQGLAIGEAPLAESKGSGRRVSECSPEQTVDSVVAAASELALDRDRPCVGTLDLLIAVMRHYPEEFEQALESRGTDRAELVDRLAHTLAAPLH